MWGRKSMAEKISARGARDCCGRMGRNQLLAFLLGGGGGGGGGLNGVGLGQALLEFVNPAGGVHKFLLAGVEGMTDVANTDQDCRPGGTRLDHVAAGATN